jgi:hypothetical protein
VRAGQAAAALGEAGEHLAARGDEELAGVGTASEAADGAVSALVAAVESAESSLGEAVAGLRDQIGQVVAGLTTTASGALAHVESTADEHQQSLAVAFGAVAEWVETASSAAVARLGDEVEAPVASAAESIPGALAELAGSLAEAARHCAEADAGVGGQVGVARDLAAAGSQLARTAVHIARSTGI